MTKSILNRVSRAEMRWKSVTASQSCGKDPLLLFIGPFMSKIKKKGKREMEGEAEMECRGIHDMRKGR